MGLPSGYSHSKSPFWIMHLLERIIGRIMGNYRCVFYFHSKPPSWNACLLESFERLWEFVGVSSSYLHITSILHCTLIGFVGLWEFVSLSFGYLHSKRTSIILLYIYLGDHSKIMEMCWSVFSLFT